MSNANYSYEFEKFVVLQQEKLAEVRDCLSIFFSSLLIV
jgi:hypothetical protein